MARWSEIQKEHNLKISYKNSWEELWNYMGPIHSIEREKSKVGIGEKLEVLSVLGNRV